MSITGVMLVWREVLNGLFDLTQTFVAEDESTLA